MSLPEGVRRLFGHLPPDATDPERHEAELIERLLENGDRADLEWLAARVPERRLAAWLEERGGRRLSDRSRAFWSLLLDRPARARSDTARALWPL